MLWPPTQNLGSVPGFNGKYKKNSYRNLRNKESLGREDFEIRVSKLKALPGSKKNKKRESREGKFLCRQFIQHLLYKIFLTFFSVHYLPFSLNLKTILREKLRTILVTSSSTKIQNPKHKPKAQAHNLHKTPLHSSITTSRRDPQEHLQTHWRWEHLCRASPYKPLQRLL